MRKQTVVITGVSGGIGAAAAKRLSAYGHKVIIIGRSSAKTESISLHEVKAIAKRRGVLTMMCKIDVKRNYVSLSVTGVLDIYAARTCRDKLNEVLLAYKRGRVLIDITGLTAKLLVIEDYEFMNESSFALSSRVGIALIVPQVWTIDGRFIERVAANNGVRLRSFTEKADALAWLMKQI